MIEKIEELLEGVVASVGGALDDLEERLTARIDRLSEFIDERTERIMGVQEDINAALAGDEAALNSLAGRVQVTIDAGVKIQAELKAANDELATLKAANPLVDTVALQQSLLRLKDHADSIDAPAPPAPAPSPGPPLPIPDPTPTPTQVGGPPPPGSKPLYTFDGTPPADASWTLTDLVTTDNQALYTFNADAPGGPATGDGLGGVWHLYTGNVVQQPATSPPAAAPGPPLV